VLTIFLFSNVIVFRGLHHPEIFNGIDISIVKQKYEKTLLPAEEKEEYARELQNYMENKKPFLNPMLSLNDLAQELALPSHDLSQILNTSFHQRFFDYINRYRVEESKRLILESANNGKTILDILYESGFNSKSVFNTAFKKHTGMTPSEFKVQ
jgi:AraC-like DNA-binding protein